jgi:hypothetical protein
VLEEGLPNYCQLVTKNGENREGYVLAGEGGLDFSAPATSNTAMNPRIGISTRCTSTRSEASTISTTNRENLAVTPIQAQTGRIGQFEAHQRL